MAAKSAWRRTYRVRKGASEGGGKRGMGLGLRQGVEWVRRGRWRAETGHGKEGDGKARVDGEEEKRETKRDRVIHEHFGSHSKKKTDHVLFRTWIQMWTKIISTHKTFRCFCSLHGLQYAPCFLLFDYSFHHTHQMHFKPPEQSLKIQIFIFHISGVCLDSCPYCTQAARAFLLTLKSHIYRAQLKDDV